ncbi:HNH endonuclease signature motif containing protein [soil metagenome]
MAKHENEAQEGFEAQYHGLEADIAGVMGVVNAANGRLVEMVADCVESELWNVYGIHSPAHWVAWQMGMTHGRAGAIVTLASRRDELPTTIAALVAGDVSLDAAVAIGQRAPADYAQSICEFAKTATMSQLSTCLRRYTYDPETEKARAKVKPVEDDRSVSTGVDGHGRWWIKGHLPVDEGAVVDQALQAARVDLYEQHRAATPEGEKPEPVTLADALVGAAESYLRHGEAATPGSDRFQVLLHLETAVSDPDGRGILTFGNGPALPDSVRRRLLCDCSVTPVWERHGAPLSVGRAQRVLSRKLRRLIEHRDGGCRIPGCTARRGLEVHHIVHWEDGGATDTSNLLSLCRRHHALHHQGLLGIEGDADPTGDLVVTDRWGHALDRAGAPIPSFAATPAEAARAAGITPGHYVHPLGERLDPKWVTFNPNPGLDLDGSGSGNGCGNGSNTPPPPIPIRPPGPIPAAAGPEGRGVPAAPSETEPGAPWSGAAPPAA